MRCEKLDVNGICQVITPHVGNKYKPHQLACRDCMQADPPMDINRVTATIIRQRCKRNNLPISKKVKAFSPESLQVETGPGTELKKLIPSFFETEECDCASYAKQMNYWGVAGCQERFTTIVEHLVDQATKNKLLNIFGKSPARLVATKMVQQAIDNSIQIEKVYDQTYAIEKWPFVWTYFASDAIGDELRYSIRCVKRWHPKARCIVIGDNPGFDVEFIEKPRIGKTYMQAFKDCYSKVLRTAELVPQFIWMMDDVYWVKDFTIKEAATPKYVRHVSQQRFKNWVPTNKWAKTRALAYEWLLENNCPTYDFASHMPQPIVSKTFLQNERELNLLENYRNWECIYFNRFYSNIAEDWGRRATRIVKKQETINPKHKLLNHTHSQFRGAVETYLNQMT
jgi:hypothetical protein